jgi:hypothetical protein
MRAVFCRYITKVPLCVCTREYGTIYRGPGFFAVVWFSSSPTPDTPFLPSASCFSFSVFLCVARRAYCQKEGVGEGGRWVKIKARPSMNHSILSGVHHTHVMSYTSRYVTGNTVIQIWHIKDYRVLYIGPADWKRNISYATQNKKYIYNSMRFFTIRRYCLLVCTFRRPFFSVNWSSLDVSCICFLTANFFFSVNERETAT